MGLVDRVKNILLSPKQEWEVIDGEAATVGSLYTGYIIPLAAIGPICQAIGYSVFGIRLPFVGTWRTPIGSAVTSALVTYALTLVGVYVLGLIIDNLAPTFKSNPERGPGAQGGDLLVHRRLGLRDLRPDPRSPLPERSSDSTACTCSIWGFRS